MSSALARRQFCRGVAGLAAVASGWEPRSGYWSQAAAAPSNAPSEKLNVGVIGVGNRGASNIAEIKTEKIAALCDVDRRYLDEMSARHPSARTYADFRELIDQAELDAVMISTPDHTHYHAARMALRKGLHVYCEKPLAHSIAEVRQLARAAGRVATQTGNQHHASAGYHRAVQIIRSGVLGPVREVHAWTNRPIWPQGIERPEAASAAPGHLDWDLWLGPAPARPYDPIYHPRRWRGWFDFGCGVLGDMGPHLLDPVVWALDLTAPTTVSAETAPLKGETFPEWSIVRFAFPARGEAPAVKLVWYDGDKQPPSEVTGLRRLPANGVFFVGERARLFAAEYGGRPIVMARNKGDDIELPKPAPTPPPNHHREWLSACRGEGTASCDFAYGARLTEICLLGNVAMRAGEEIHWDHQQMSTTNDVDVSHFLQRGYREGWEAES